MKLKKLTLPMVVREVSRGLIVFAKIQALAAIAVGRAEFRGHGGGLPHLAAATHQRHDSGSRPRRKYLDYHPIDRVS